MLVAECVSYVCIWQLDRIALHTKQWFPVATSQLAGNAVGRILPGGGVTASSLSASMLHRAGFDTGDAFAALGASSALQVGTTFALPLVALPAIAGGAPVDRGLTKALYLGAAVLVLLIAFGLLVFTTDRPLELAGRAAQWVLNKTVRRHDPVHGLDRELLAYRDFVRGTLGENWKGAVLAGAGSAAFDFLALLCALRAVGADPRPSLVLLAYTAAEALALIPLTPGGLGFVEAGLTGTLKLAGVPAADAFAATLLYRIVSYWLPLPAGGVAYLLFRRRYG